MHENTKPELSPAERHKALGKFLDTISERERRKALYQRLREDPATKSVLPRITIMTLPGRLPFWHGRPRRGRVEVADELGERRGICLTAEFWLRRLTKRLRC